MRLGWVTYAFVSFAIILIALNIALVRKNRVLLGAQRSCEATLHLNAGDSLPPMRGTDAFGRTIFLAYGGGQPVTLLLIFLQECPDCEMNLPRWQGLVRALRGKRIRFVFVSLDGVIGAGELNKIGLGEVGTVVRPDFATLLAYRIQYTPQTVLISGGGRVQGVWSGVLARRDELNIEDMARASFHSSGRVPSLGK